MHYGLGSKQQEGHVAVKSWTCDQYVVSLIPTGTKLRNYLGQVVHTYVPLISSSKNKRFRSLKDIKIQEETQEFYL